MSAGPPLPKARQTVCGGVHQTDHLGRCSGEACTRRRLSEVVATGCYMAAVRVDNIGARIEWDYFSLIMV